MPFIVVLKLPFFCWTCLDGYIIEVEQCKAGKGLPGTTPDIGSCSSESLRYWIPAVSHWWFTDLQPYSTFPLFSLLPLTQGLCSWARARGFALSDSAVLFLVLWWVLWSSLMNDAPSCSALVILCHFILLTEVLSLDHVLVPRWAMKELDCIGFQTHSWRTPLITWLILAPRDTFSCSPH